jgi:hypothetical protein
LASAGRDICRGSPLGFFFKGARVYLGFEDALDLLGDLPADGAQGLAAAAAALPIPPTARPPTSERYTFSDTARPAREASFHRVRKCPKIIS